MTASGCVVTSDVQRVTDLSERDFIRSLRSNVPLVCADATKDWPALDNWHPRALRRRFGSHEVQVYDEAFLLTDVCTLARYLDRYFDAALPPPEVPYVRWYSRLKSADFVWACAAFREMQEAWRRPYFFPRHSYILPFCAQPDALCPTRDLFPARGLFISGKGARTTWHIDPWGTDALLVQVYGEKLWRMRHSSVRPSRDVASEGAQQEATELQFRLRPGEAVLVPAGWQHDVVSVTDSVSLTWNFVHSATANTLLSFLANGPTEEDLQVLRFFYRRFLPENADAPAVADFVRGKLEGLSVS